MTPVFAGGLVGPPNRPPHFRWTAWCQRGGQEQGPGYPAAAAGEAWRRGPRLSSYWQALGPRSQEGEGVMVVASVVAVVAAVAVVAGPHGEDAIGV